LESVHLEDHYVDGRFSGDGRWIDLALEHGHWQNSVLAVLHFQTYVTRNNQTSVLSIKTTIMVIKTLKYICETKE
jgi:hypothetical protein